MVTVSDSAAEKTKEILSTEGKADWGLRFYTAGSSCCGPSYGIDIVENPVDGDEVIEKNGTKFFIEKATSEKMNGMEIHFIDDGQQQGFVLKSDQPPSCGPECGPSCG
jgi:iron-sulfur cluster assembly protein